MRGNAIAIGLLAAAVVSWIWVATARANENNQTMKWCLEQTGYKLENFNTFDFRKASKCHSDYRIGKNKIQNEKIRQFLKKKPWFRGTNFKWEEKAEYSCSHINTLNGSAVVCQKPYYVN